MTKVQDRAIELVNSHNGMRGRDLFGKLSVEFIKYEAEIIGSLVGNLVEKGEIIAIHYGPSGNEFSFFVPKGSAIKVIDNAEYTIN